MVQIRELLFLMQRETLEKCVERRSWGLCGPGPCDGVSPHHKGTGQPSRAAHTRLRTARAATANVRGGARLGTGVHAYIPALANVSTPRTTTDA